MKKYVRCEDGEVYSGVIYDNGTRVELPINKDGTIKWFDDKKLVKKSA